MELVELSKVCDLKNGFAFKSKDYVEISDTLSCRMSSIRPGGYFDLHHNKRFLPNKFINLYSDYLLKDGDIVIAMTDLAGDPKILGVPTIVKTEGKFLLQNQRVGKLIIKDDKQVFVPYLQYALNRSENKSYYKKFASGGLQINIGKKEILGNKIPLPSLEIQKKIASILEQADKIRQLNKQLIDKYDALTQSLFLEMFGDPVLNPKGWEKVKFNEVGKLDRGKSKHRPRNAPELLGGEYPLIQTGDVANSGGYITKFKSTYSEIGLAQSKMWDSGTLCITIAANIAKTGILTFDACFPDSVVGFIPNEKTNVIYTQFWISFLQKILEDSAPESAQKNINLSILRDLDFMNPPLKLQNEFAERVKIIENQKKQAEVSLQKSEDLFNSLLQKAFKGALVKE
ncbi:restriction endonuclease subunit S [Tenacibaculum finnmarkense]|uniref:Restriction endonuclease, type I, HsdS n=1 Tax=Tenacibaculum finnmarkense genomovar ulcerans TaxID=2781388 RepID=A0A2I2M9S7_9FLAO|nr:restriction endonuclease subunit S [Tenacibaculum finnmarkense]MBE7697012.1 restriction endonuclease subunit S [Tenacibaculum finnmarkense genomovar ulcerans]SOU88800.1 Restriction endonuclease, type I, HsdS [Tenacibaculum finnmarkense genomovar ulcerans]